MSHRSPFKAVLAAILIMVAASASAATITRISPDEGLGRVDFKQLAINARGDFVAVTRTQVFMGHVGNQSIDKIFAEEKANFVLEGSGSIQLQNQVLTTNVEWQQTRLALADSGDFVLASNKSLFVGNARIKMIRLVATADTFMQFQQVAVNENGDYVATTHKSVIGGRTSTGDAKVLVKAPKGDFGAMAIYGLQSRVDVYVGETRLALNDRGQFVAITGSAVYAGEVATDVSLTPVLEQARAGFKHVVLNENGDFVVVTDKEVFAGSF